MSQIKKEYSLELISIIKEQTETLLAYEHKVPQIEIDIVKDNLKKLYEIVDGMNKTSAIQENYPLQEQLIDDEINNLIDEAESQFIKEDGLPSENDLLIEQEKAFEEQNTIDLIEPEIPDEETITKVHEDILNQVEEAVEEIIAQSKPEIPSQNTPTELPIPTEETGNEKRTIHVLDVDPEDEEDENEAVSDDAMVNKSINLKAIKSLKNGIGINDKFMIINDLFEGHAKSYNKAILTIDSAPDRKQALYILADLKAENFWENNDFAFKQLKTYVERRFL